MAKFLYKELSYAVIGAAMEVHNQLGPGFPEKIYQAAVEHELTLRDIPFVRQFHVPIDYKGQRMADFYLDLVIDQKIDLELKALSDLTSAHEAQTIAYLKASGLRLGLLLNFGRASLQTKRVIL